MVIILSPSKTLRKEKIYHPESNLPLFPEMTGKLMRKLQRMTKPKLKSMMGISDDLTQLNYSRFKDFDPDFNENMGEPAIFIYQGDAYQGLNAPSWSEEDLKYAESRLLILSGLYGLLKPSTLVQPYRLEMGGRFKPGRNTNLYKYWKDTLTSYLKTNLQQQNEKIVVNLASKEYSDALDFNKIDGTILDVHFREWRNEQWKFISYDSKKARGTMARYIIQLRIEKPELLKDFDLDGYGYNEELSSEGELFFTKQS